MSGMAVGPATVPFMRRRCPALGFGDRRMPAGIWGARDTIRSVAWSHDQRHILSASHDRSVRIWESETGRCIEVLSGHDECVVNAVWTLDRGSVLSCDSSGGLRAFTVDASSNSRQFEPNSSEVVKWRVIRQSKADTHAGKRCAVRRGSIVARRAFGMMTDKVGR